MFPRWSHILANQFQDYLESSIKIVEMYIFLQTKEIKIIIMH